MRLRAEGQPVLFVQREFTLRQIDWAERNIFLPMKFVVAGVVDEAAEFDSRSRCDTEEGIDGQNESVVRGKLMSEWIGVGPSFGNRVPKRHQRFTQLE